MIIEHQSDAYDAAKQWLYLNAKSQFVASAFWYSYIKLHGPFDGPSNKKYVSKLISAETDDIAELRAWCAVQISQGARLAIISETWPIPESYAPKGHRLHGKRENRFIERVDNHPAPSC